MWEKNDGALGSVQAECASTGGTARLDLSVTAAALLPWTPASFAMHLLAGCSASFSAERPGASSSTRFTSPAGINIVASVLVAVEPAAASPSFHSVQVNAG